jgi:hypothetical protein
VQRAPGIPCALLFLGRRFVNDSGASRRGIAELRAKFHPVIASHDGFHAEQTSKIVAGADG